MIFSLKSAPGKFVVALLRAGKVVLGYPKGLKDEVREDREERELRNCSEVGAQPAGEMQCLEIESVPTENNLPGDQGYLLVCNGYPCEGYELPLNRATYLKLRESELQIALLGSTLTQSQVLAVLSNAHDKGSLPSHFFITCNQVRGDFEELITVGNLYKYRPMLVDLRASVCSIAPAHFVGTLSELEGSGKLPRQRLVPSSGPT